MVFSLTQHTNLRDILQARTGMIYLASRVVWHAQQVVLSFGRHCPTMLRNRHSSLFGGLTVITESSPFFVLPFLNTSNRSIMATAIAAIAIHGISTA